MASKWQEYLVQRNAHAAISLKGVTGEPQEFHKMTNSTEMMVVSQVKE